MPTWIYSRAPDDCDLNESRVAHKLRTLSDNWIICWGFYYKDNQGTQREGDFLVFGSDGHLAVIEVKKRVRHNARTGNWGNESDSPVYQIMAERSGVYQCLLDQSNQRKENIPYIFPLLVGCENNSKDPKPAGLDAQQVIYGFDALSNFSSLWQNAVSTARPCKNIRVARELFLAAYGENLDPKVSARFLKESDRLLMQQITADYSLLDALEGNPRLLVRGGAGSGKSWMAMEQARRWAEAGQHVLFLCYNKDFGAESTRRIGQLKRTESAAPITVRTWEALAEELIASAGLDLPHPAPDAPRSELEVFYKETLPNAMLDALTHERFQPVYDALVVDEGQDHDTATPAATPWWEIYFGLLKSGCQSRISVYYDPAQRPGFRDKDGSGFSDQKLKELLPDATWVALKQNRRYTRRLVTYLQSLQSLATTDLIAGISAESAVEGEDPVLTHSQNYESALAEAGKQIKRWKEEWGISPEDILVLCNQSPFEGDHAPLAQTEKLAGHRLVDVAEAVGDGNTNTDCIRCTSFNKSKGLDAKVVLMVHTYSFEDLSENYQAAFWLAASRSRQLLAICSHARKA